MALVFYVSDSDTGIYRIEEGLGITHVFDTPDAIPCAGVTHNGAGQIVGLGQPTSGTGPTYAQAFGFLLNADDLSVIDDFWGPDFGSSSGQWIDVDNPPRTHSDFNLNFDGSGALYDPDHDEVLVSTIMRGYPEFDADQDSEDQVAHLSPAGVFLKADADDTIVSPSPFLSSVQAQGVALLNGVFYYCCGPQGSIASYDTVTGAQQCARNCFTALDDGGKMVDLQADPDNGWLWRLPSGGSSDGIGRIMAFDPADVPWGTTGGTPPTFRATVQITDDNDGGWGYYKAFDETSFLFVGDLVVAAVQEWDSNDLSFITVARDGSSTAPTLIYQDTGNVITGGIAWDMMAFPDPAPGPNLAGNITDRRHNFWRSAPSLGQSNG